MKKQTAVEWLLDNIYLLNSLKWNEVIEQAKEMEKQQMLDAYNVDNTSYYPKTEREKQAEQYYNETYGGNK
jgi:hypothetical protein